MGDQLIKISCTGGDRENINPLTTSDSVIDVKSGKTLDTLIDFQSGVWLPLVNNSKKQTKLLVPLSMRKRGLFSTYVTSSGRIIQEWYIGNTFDDDAWTTESNWKPVPSIEVEDKLKKAFSWYKA